MDTIAAPQIGRVSRLWRAIKAAPSSTPLRVQLILLVLILVASGLIISSLAGAAALRGYLLNRVDSQLASTVTDTFHRGYITTDGGGPALSSNGGPALSEAFYTEISDETGRGRGQLRTPFNANQSAPQLPSLALPLSQNMDGHPFTVSSVKDGSDWRVLVTTLPDGSGALTVGTTLEDVNSTVHRLQIIDMIVSALVLALLGLVGYLVVQASLMRLSEVEETADAIANGDLTRRVPEWPEKTEVGRLARSFNSMLAQIEAAFASSEASEHEARASEERMRRFVADASHELRTPLTSIRGFAELRRQGAVNSPELVDRSLEKIESEAQRMTLLVEDLLLLARLDQQRPLEMVPVDLKDVIVEIAQGAPVIAPEHVFNVEVQQTGQLLVVGDEARLHQVFGNLINNAFTHTPEGTNVTVRLREEPGWVVGEVQDDGPGMTHEEAAHAFERFYRADPARTRAQGGSGLGLSIVSGIVEAHGGVVTLASEPGHGALFQVRLPAAPVPLALPAAGGSPDDGSAAAG